jgi:Ca-activated chloride channel family protein
VSFAHPGILFFLIVPAGLVAWVWRRRGRRLVLPFDHGRHRKGRRWYVLVSIAETLWPALLAVAIVILAGPRRFGEPQDKRILTNIEICVDVSGSMTAPFGDGSRYDTAMKAVEDFCNFRKGDAFGLTFFGNNTLHWCPLTTDVSAIRCAPPFMRPENAPHWLGGTMIGKALRSCKQVLEQRQEGDRMIILISDGDSFDLAGGNAETIAKELRAAQIALFGIIIDAPRLQDEIVTITATTGGDVFQAGDPDALTVVFQRIDRMKQARLEKTMGETKDDFFLYCVAGLALLSMGTLSLFGLRYTPW